MMTNPFKKPSLPAVDPNTAILEAASEAERWNPIPGSSGKKAHVTTSDDEDEEGHSLDEKLVVEGMVEAEQDQVLQAARSAAKNDI